MSKDLRFFSAVSSSRFEFASAKPSSIGFSNTEYCSGSIQTGKNPSATSADAETPLCVIVAAYIGISSSQCRILFSGLPRPVAPAPVYGREYIFPSKDNGASLAKIRFIIWTYSLRRLTGLPYGTPCQPSTTCGPDAPTPQMNRPPDSSARLIAVMAAIAGERAGICIMAVPTFIFCVCASIHAAGVTASDPYASAVQIDS